MTSEDHPPIIIFPPLLWLIVLGASALWHFILFSTRMMPWSWAIGLGVIVMLLGFVLVAQARGVMHAAGTNVDPYKPALTIVRRGPYRFTRNPMYLALCLTQVGLGLLLNDWVTLLFVVPLALVLHFGVVLREEGYLEVKFGEDYRAFKRAVRRWF